MLFFAFSFSLCSIQHLAHDSESRYLSAEEQSRELTRSIRREVGKLSEQWNNLIDRSDNWKHRLDEYMTVSQLKLYLLVYACNNNCMKVYKAAKINFLVMLRKTSFKWQKFRFHFFALVLNLR